MGWEKFYLVFLSFHLAFLAVYLIYTNVSGLDIITLSTLPILLFFLFFSLSPFRHLSLIYLLELLFTGCGRRSNDFFGIVWNKVRLTLCRVRDKEYACDKDI